MLLPQGTEVVRHENVPNPIRRATGSRLSYLEVVVRNHDLEASETMPTVLRDGPYSFVFFSSDRGEPVHIHVKRERRVAKFWLDPIELATNRGFSEPELNDIERLVRQHEQTLRQGWHEHFDS